MSLSPSSMERLAQLPMMSTILIIDDDPEICKLIKEILNRQNFQVLTAVDGDIGLALARQYYPDLILCDIQMQAINGYEVLQQLRTDHNMVAIPFVFLTGRASTQDIRAGLASGADDYLVKPFSSEELLATVKVRLRQREQLKAFYSQSLDQLRRNIAIALPHEFRTPLVGILGASSFLLNAHRDLEPALVDELLADIHTSGQRLHDLIQKFLYFVRLQGLEQTKDVSFVPMLGGIPELVRAVNEKVMRPAGREADFQTEITVGAIAMRATDLETLLRELLENAVKFSQSGTLIHLKITQVEQSCQIEITDQGLGMTAEQISQIGAYQQFDRERQEQQGMGLGLAIAQLIIRLYAGTWQIHSQPNQGARITIDLPQPPMT